MRLTLMVAARQSGNKRTRSSVLIASRQSVLCRRQGRTIELRQGTTKSISGMRVRKGRDSTGACRIAFARRLARRVAPTRERSIDRIVSGFSGLYISAILRDIRTYAQTLRRERPNKRACVRRTRSSDRLSGLKLRGGLLRSARRQLQVS